MYGRYRNGRGNGFRSNAMATGSMGPTSRTSPAGSFRGRRMHNHEHRNYNRGGYACGGGHSYRYQHPPRETSIFVEAGKLAAEYLVSKRVLPPNALSGKFPLDDLRNLLSNFPGFKSHAAGNSQNLRGSSRSPSGNSVLDGGREIRSTGLLAEKGIALPKVEADGDDASAVNLDGRYVDKDLIGGIEKSSPGEIMPKVNESHKKSGFDKSEGMEGRDVKSINAGVKFCDESMAVKERNDDDLEQKDDETKEDLSSMKNGSLVIEDYADLVKQCRFVNVPTKTRSSMKTKGLKKHSVSPSEDPKGEVSEGLQPVIHVIDVDAGTSLGNVSPHQNNLQKILQLDASKDPTLEVEDGAILVTTKQRQHLRSDSFSEGSLLPEDKKPGEELWRLASLNTRLGGKRAFDDETDQIEGLKKLKACDSIMDAESCGQPRSCSAVDDKSELDEPKTSIITRPTSIPDRKSLYVSTYSRAEAKSCEIKEQKPLFPVSFETCNVYQSADAARTTRSPPLTQTQTPINIGFSTSNNGNPPHNKLGIAKNNIEIIDLEDDFIKEEEKTFSNPEKRGDTVFTDLDSFSSTVDNTNGMSDSYGPMILELLGNESPSCSSGILGDDESIYMSLGEIPLSLLGPWEQPRQDYGKPF